MNKIRALADYGYSPCGLGPEQPPAQQTNFFQVVFTKSIRGISFFSSSGTVTPISASQCALAFGGGQRVDDVEIQLALEETEVLIQHAEQGDGEEGKNEGGIRTDMPPTKDNAGVDDI